MTKNNYKLHTTARGIRHWALIFQYGVTVETHVDCSVRQLLEAHFNLAHDYVESRIQTVFLDGMPVDDISTAMVHDRARMGLAAALPGAAGIAMRRNSPYAALRGDITRPAENAMQSKPGSIELRLFNHIMEEQGPALLQRGVLTSGYRFANLLTSHPSEPLAILSGDSQTSMQDALDWAQKKPETQLRLRVTLSE